MLSNLNRNKPCIKTEGAEWEEERYSSMIGGTEVERWNQIFFGKEGRGEGGAGSDEQWDNKTNGQEIAGRRRASRQELLKI